MRRIVADTGPILHLWEANALFLLSLAGKVFIPPQVMKELRTHAPEVWPGQPPEWLGIQSLSAAARNRSKTWQQSGLLHAGEAEALALVFDLKPDWFLTDDAAARLTGESLGIECRGSLGVLLWAAANRKISREQAGQLLHDLENSSLWLSASVRLRAREALAELFF